MEEPEKQKVPSVTLSSLNIVESIFLHQRMIMKIIEISKLLSIRVCFALLHLYLM